MKIQRLYEDRGLLNESPTKLNNISLIESNEYRKFYGKRIDKLSNDRGLGNDKRYSAMLDWLYNCHGVRFVVHHGNGNHKDNTSSNIYFLPETVHNRLFNLAVHRIETSDVTSRDSNRVKMGIYSSIKQINNLIDKFNKTYSGVTELLPFVELPQEITLYGKSTTDDIEFIRKSKLETALFNEIKKLAKDKNNFVYSLPAVKKMMANSNL